MRIEVSLQEVDSGKVWDVSELLTEFSWQTQIESSFPGKLEFKLIEDAQLTISNGNKLELKVDSQNLFKGVVRSFSTTEKPQNSLSAYDSKFLLKSKDTIVFPVQTLTNRFVQCCSAAGIPHTVINSPGYACGEFIADAQSYYEMIQKAIDETRSATQERYIISDNFGTLELFNLNHLVSNVILGDDSLITAYNFDASIEESINSVKVIKEDSESKQRQIALAKDEANVKRWGLLQDVVSPDDSESNQGQMQNQANNLLAENNKETQTLSLECIGQLGIKSGSTLTLQIEKLRKYGLFDKKVLITKCTHKFSKIHTMSLDVEVID